MNADVFISHHTNSSRHIVEAISNKLESMGIRCWHSGKDLHGGDFASSIMSALESCKIFLLVLNRPASQSAHVLNELEIVTDRLGRQEDVVILPFHVADEEISPAAKYYIKRHHWIDAMDPPMWQRVDELTAHVALLLGKTEVPAHTPSSPSYRLLSRLPQAREVFDGRDSVIEQIAKSFESGKRVLFLEGIGGIGKSELAKQYALRHESSYDHILFVTFSTTLQKLVCDSDQISIDGLERAKNESDEAFFSRKLQILRSLGGDRTLIIVDNFDVDDDPCLKEFASCGCRIIFTTRNGHPSFPTIKVTAIEDMDVLMGIFEQNYGDHIPDDEREAMEEIFRLIEYHTYTIELIAKQMEASFLSAPEMLEIVKRGTLRHEVSETVAGRHDRKTAFGHICSLFNTSGLANEEKKLLMYLSLMGTQGVSAARFKEWAGLENFESVNRMVRRSWVRKERGQRLSLHPLVKEVVHHELKPTADNCCEFLTRITEFCFFAWFRPYEENVAVAGNILSLLEYFSPPDAGHYRIFIHYPNFLWQVGRFEESVFYGHKVYDAFLRHHGDASMVSGLAAQYLGGCYFNSGRIRESIAWYKKGLECMLASGVGDHEDLGMSYEKVARCYTWEYEQDFAKAEELFQVSLDMRVRLRDGLSGGRQYDRVASYEPYDVQLANDRIGEVYMELGRMYQAMGDYQQASHYSQLQLDILVRNRPDNLSGIAYCHYDLGVCRYHQALQARRNSNTAECDALLKQAEDYLSMALESNMKMRGGLAIDTIDNQEYLADVYKAQDRKGDASNAYMAVLTMVENLLGPTHPRLADVKKKMSF